VKCGKVKLGAVALKVLVQQMQQQSHTGSCSPCATYLLCRLHVMFLDRIVVWNTEENPELKKFNRDKQLGVTEILYEMSRNFK
jgi:hypothetical protein